MKGFNKLSKLWKSAMNERGTGQPPLWRRPQIVKLATGVGVFGVLMGLRTDFEDLWVRALVAACAGAALGWALLQARRDSRT